MKTDMIIAAVVCGSMTLSDGVRAQGPDAPYSIETVIENLEIPWSIAWDGAGRMIFTERVGRVRVFENGALRPEPLYTVPNLFGGKSTEIGLMGLCLHPEFEKNRYVYLAYGFRDGPQRDVRVVRFRESSGQTGKPSTLIEDKVIMSGAPAGSNHAGCAIRFGPDKKLYITCGEMFRRELAQDMTSLGGKILRVNDDGSVPADNPFVGDEHAKKGVRPEIWSLGHRNPQGIDWQPGTGRLFSTEHGPSGEAGTAGDELNFVEKGKNYGWPTIHHDQKQDGLESPLFQWSPAIAPASGVFYDGDKFPAWKGNFFFGALGGLSNPRRPGVMRIVIEGDKYVSQERLAGDLGRIRAVEVGPDGFIYFSTSNRDGRGRAAENDDRIMRIVPRAK